MQWDKASPDTKEAWAAAAIACAPELQEAEAALEERDVSLARLTSQLATVRADSEARIVELEAQLREASLTAALEAQTSADLRRVNDALRAQLAEAQAEAESLCGAEKAADKHVQTLEAQLADVRTFANFEAEKAKDYARQLREAQHRVEWETRKDGSRALIRHRLIVEELGSVGPRDVGANARGVSYAYRVDDVTGSGVHTDSAHDIEQLLSAAQRIVETLTGVKP
jgi:chromosome segregation ATPase